MVVTVAVVKTNDTKMFRQFEFMISKDDSQVTFFMVNMSIVHIYLFQMKIACYRTIFDEKHIRRF